MELQSEESAAEDSPEDSGGEGKLRPEHPLALLLRLRSQTKQQLLEYKSMVDSNEVKTLEPEELMEDEQIEAKIEGLEKEIEEVKTDFEMKKLALDRMQLSTALKNHMEKNDSTNSTLMETMKHIVKLNKSIIGSQQESWGLEKQLLEVRKKRLELKQASEIKFSEIQTEKNKQKSDLNSMGNSGKIEIIQQKLQKEIEITTVIQHVFQNLILGSKVNWAEDSTLKEIVLQLEKTLTIK